MTEDKGFAQVSWLPSKAFFFRVALAEPNCFYTKIQRPLVNTSVAASSIAVSPTKQTISASRRSPRPRPEKISVSPGVPLFSLQSLNSPGAGERQIGLTGPSDSSGTFEFCLPVSSPHLTRRGPGCGPAPRQDASLLGLGARRRFWPLAAAETQSGSPDANTLALCLTVISPATIRRCSQLPSPGTAPGWLSPGLALPRVGSPGVLASITIAASDDVCKEIAAPSQCLETIFGVGLRGEDRQSLVCIGDLKDNSHSG